MQLIHSTVAVALTFSLGVMTPHALAVTDEEVGQAIDHLKKYLYSKQDPRTGSWEGTTSHNKQIGGETALVTLALLISGESAQNTQIKKALKYLHTVEMTGVYAVSMRAHVWAQLPPNYMPMLDKDFNWLLHCANKHKLGLFDYHLKESDYVDHSLTQYGMLGVWEASKRGLKVPPKYWERWVEHFISAQREDGGWAYGLEERHPTTGSMTAAGLTALYVGQQELYREGVTFHPKFAKALEKGVAWLDQRFNGVNNPNANEWTYYYLYGIERVALGSGLRFFNEQGLVPDGGKPYRPCGSRQAAVSRMITAKSAFALMFLSRGRVPVWVHKLKVPNHSME